MKATCSLTGLLIVASLAACGGQEDNNKKNPTMGCVKTTEVCDGQDNDCNGVVDDGNVICDCLKDEDCAGELFCNGTEVCKDHECVQQDDNKCPDDKVCDVESGECVGCLLDSFCIDTGQGRRCEPSEHTCVDCTDNTDCRDVQVCAEDFKCVNKICPDDDDVCTREFASSHDCASETVAGCCNANDDCGQDQFCEQNTCHDVLCENLSNECLQVFVSDHENCEYVPMENCCASNVDCVDGLQCDSIQHSCVECLISMHCTRDEVCNNAGECVLAECPTEDSDICTEFVFSGHECKQERVSSNCCHTSNDCESLQECANNLCVPKVCPDDGNVCTRESVVNHECATAPVNNCCQSTSDCRMGECVQNVCTGCLRSTDCDDNNWCNGTETCINNLCRSATSQCLGSDNLQCDNEARACFECLDSDYHCQGRADQSEKYCLSRECVACRADSDCTEAGKSYCDPVGHTCVACTANVQCDDGSWCTGEELCSGNVCKSGTSPCATSERSAEQTLICYEDADLQVCVECLTENDCGSGVCIDNMCKECLTDTDCAERSDGRVLCQQDNNMCVECRDSNDCWDTESCSNDKTCDPVVCPDNMAECKQGRVVNHLCQPYVNKDDNKCCVPGDTSFCHKRPDSLPENYIWTCSTQSTENSSDWHGNFGFEYHTCTSGIDEDHDGVCGTVELCRANSLDDDCDGLGGHGTTPTHCDTGDAYLNSCDLVGTTIQITDGLEESSFLMAMGGSYTNPSRPSNVMDRYLTSPDNVIGDTCSVKAFAYLIDIGWEAMTPEYQHLICQMYFWCTNYSGEKYVSSLSSAQDGLGQVCVCSFDGAKPPVVE